MLKKFQTNEPALFHIQLNYIEDSTSVHEFIFSLAIFSQYYTSKGIFFLPKKSKICIEIPNTYNDNLLKSLSFLQYLKKIHIEKLDLSRLIINEKIRHVCTYLKAYETGLIDKEEFRFNKPKNKEEFRFNKPKNKEEFRFNKPKNIAFNNEVIIELINKYFLKNCISFPTFHQLSVFFNILSQMLINFENSTYSPEMINIQKKEMKGIPSAIYDNLRSTIFESLLETTKEFTNIDSVRDNQISAFSKLEDKDSILIAENKFCKAWENSSHFSMLFVDDGSFICIYRDSKIIPKNIKEFLFIQKYLETMSTSSIQSKFLQSLSNKLASNEIEAENYNEMTCDQLIEKLVTFYFQFSSRNSGQIPKEQYKPIRITELARMGYVLTPDNFLKMNLIFIRCISNIPLIIMGETGVGKTSLIRFFVREILQEQLEIICIHSGLTWKQIFDKISEINDKAKIQKDRIWVFLDEFNTSECVGMICDILCEKKLGTLQLANNIILVGACNPYRTKPLNCSYNENVGIKKASKYHSETNKLVHIVKPLPYKALEFVWDFGVLRTKETKEYIKSILKNVETVLIDEFTEVISVAHEYFTKKEDASSVSLRDVKRFTELYS